MRMKKMIGFACLFALSVGVCLAESPASQDAAVADWMSGAYGVGWIFRAQDASEIAGWDIDTLVAQVQTIPNVTYVNFNLSDAAGGSQFLAPHSVLSDLYPTFVPNDRDLFTQALTKFKAAGYKVVVYYSCQGPALLKHGVEKAIDAVDDGNGGYTSESMDAWSNHVYSVYGTVDRETYMKAHAEIIFAEYAQRYGSLIDSWWLDNGIDNFDAPLHYAIAKTYNPDVVIHTSTAPTTENDVLSGHPTPLKQAPASSDANLPQLANIECSAGGYQYVGDHPCLGNMYMAMGTAWYAGDIVWSVEKAADWIQRTLDAGGTWCWSYDCTDSQSIIRQDMVDFTLEVHEQMETNATNAAPVFVVESIQVEQGVMDVAYTGTLYGCASDAEGDSLIYSKLSGPDWLNVATNGTLSGTPTNGDLGVNSFQVGAGDAKGNNTLTTLDVWVDSGLESITSVKLADLRGLIGTIPTINDSTIEAAHVAITKAAHGNDVVYSLSLSQQDFEGGGSYTDSLSWDIRVKGFTGSTYDESSSLTLGASALVGTVNNEFGISGSDSRFLNVGESIQFSVENVVLMADAGCTAQFNGFSGLWGTKGSYIYGAGTAGLEASTPKSNGALTFETNTVLTVTSLGTSQRIRNLDASFTISPSKFNVWIGGFELPNDELLPELDADGDGLDNLTEYAFGGDPSQDDAMDVSPRAHVVDEAGIPWFYHISDQRADDPSLIFTLGTKTNLNSSAPWDSTDIFFVGETAPVNSYKTVTNRTEAATESKFIRLDVQQN